MTTDLSNFDKRWWSAHYVPFLFYYYCKNKDGIYICEETGCMYQTTVKRNLRRHNLARHSDTPNNGVKFDCHICDAKLASKGSLFNHVKHVHERYGNTGYGVFSPGIQN